MKKARFSLGLIRSLMIVAVVATVVTFLGLRLAEGEPPPPRNPPLSTPVPTAPVIVPFPAQTPLGEPSSPVQPSSIVINGQEVPLPPGATTGKIIADCVPPAVAPPGRCSPFLDIIQRGDSFISFDELGIIAERIAPEDEADFQPVVDALE